MNPISLERPAAPIPLRSQAPRALHDFRSEHEAMVRSKVHHSAHQLVADALVTPVLAQCRESLKHGGTFGVSTAEERLGPMIDQRVADAIVHRSRMPIVDNVEASMLRRVHLKPEPRPGSPTRTHGPTQMTAFGKARIA